MNKTGRYALLIAGAVLLVALASLGEVAAWCGGFRQAEFQVTFIDEQGRPIPGIELRVENANGVTFYHYPVTDYLADSTPTSDGDGLLTLHHVQYPAVEFSGTCGHLFWFIPIGNCNSPTFICRFFSQGKEVFKCDFRDLTSPECDAHQEVIRPWTWENYVPFVYPDYAAVGWWEEQRRAYDKDGNGSLDREEGAAFSAATSAVEKIENVKRHAEPAAEELTFPVFRKNIVVDQRI